MLSFGSRLEEPGNWCEKRIGDNSSGRLHPLLHHRCGRSFLRCTRLAEGTSQVNRGFKWQDEWVVSAGRQVGMNLEVFHLLGRHGIWF